MMTNKYKQFKKEVKDFVDECVRPYVNEGIKKDRERIIRNIESSIKAFKEENKLSQKEKTQRILGLKSVINNIKVDILHDAKPKQS